MSSLRSHWSWWIGVQPFTLLKRLGVRRPPVDPRVIAEILGVDVYGHAVATIAVLEEFKAVVRYDKTADELTQKWMVAWGLGVLLTGNMGDCAIVSYDVGPRHQSRLYQKGINFAMNLMLPNSMVIPRIREPVRLLAADFCVSETVMVDRLRSLRLR